MEKPLVNFRNWVTTFDLNKFISDSLFRDIWDDSFNFVKNVSYNNYWRTIKYSCFSSDFDPENLPSELMTEFTLTELQEAKILKKRLAYNNGRWVFTDSRLVFNGRYAQAKNRISLYFAGSYVSKIHEFILEHYMLIAGTGLLAALIYRRIKKKNEEKLEGIKTRFNDLIDLIITLAIPFCMRSYGIDKTMRICSSIYAYGRVIMSCFRVANWSSGSIKKVLNKVQDKAASASKLSELNRRRLLLYTDWEPDMIYPVGKSAKRTIYEWKKILKKLEIQNKFPQQSFVPSVKPMFDPSALPSLKIEVEDFPPCNPPQPPPVIESPVAKSNRSPMLDSPIIQDSHWQMWKRWSNGLRYLLEQYDSDPTLMEYGLLKYPVKMSEEEMYAEEYLSEQRLHHEVDDIIDDVKVEAKDDEELEDVESYKKDLKKAPFWVLAIFVLLIAIIYLIYYYDIVNKVRTKYANRKDMNFLNSLHDKTWDLNNTWKMILRREELEGKKGKTKGRAQSTRHVRKSRKGDRKQSFYILYDENGNAIMNQEDFEALESRIERMFQSGLIDHETRNEWIDKFERAMTDAEWVKYEIDDADLNAQLHERQEGIISVLQKHYSKELPPMHASSICLACSSPKNDDENRDHDDCDSVVVEEKESLPKVKDVVKRPSCEHCKWYIQKQRKHVCNECRICAKKDDLENHICGTPVTRVGGIVTVKEILKNDPTIQASNRSKMSKESKPKVEYYTKEQLSKMSNDHLSKLGLSKNERKEGLNPNKPKMIMPSNHGIIRLKVNGKHNSFGTIVNNHVLFTAHCLDNFNFDEKDTFEVETSGMVQDEYETVPINFHDFVKIGLEETVNQESIRIFERDDVYVVPLHKIPTIKPYSTASAAQEGPITIYTFDQNSPTPKVTSSPGMLVSVKERRHNCSTTSGDCGSPLFDKYGRCVGFQISTLGRDIELGNNFFELTAGNENLFKFFRSNEFRSRSKK